MMPAPTTRLRHVSDACHSQRENVAARRGALDLSLLLFAENS
ncbi:UNVERIFIED_ORG: hypothetical protein BCL66_10628 [Martelella mediterranea]